MEHSQKFTLVKDYYDRGLWSDARLLNSVGKWITQEEYEEIINPVNDISEGIEPDSEYIENSETQVNEPEEPYENTYIFDENEENPNIIESEEEPENDNIAEEIENGDPDYVEWDESMIEDIGDDTENEDNHEEVHENGSDEFFDEFYDEELHGTGYDDPEEIDDSSE